MQYEKNIPVYIAIWNPRIFFCGNYFSILLWRFLWRFMDFYFWDNPRPASTETFTSILFVFIFLILWIGLIVLGYRIGRRLENDSSVDRKHVLVSMSLTALFILFIVFQQWSVGNL